MKRNYQEAGLSLEQYKDYLARAQVSKPKYKGSRIFLNPDPEYSKLNVSNRTEDTGVTCVGMFMDGAGGVLEKNVAISLSKGK